MRSAHSTSPKDSHPEHSAESASPPMFGNSARMRQSKGLVAQNAKFIPANELLQWCDDACIYVSKNAVDFIFCGRTGQFLSETIRFGGIHTAQSLCDIPNQKFNQTNTHSNGSLINTDPWTISWMVVCSAGFATRCCKDLVFGQADSVHAKCSYLRMPADLDRFPHAQDKCQSISPRASPA